jgi:hypothetical protein
MCPHASPGIDTIRDYYDDFLTVLVKDRLFTNWRHRAIFRLVDRWGTAALSSRGEGARPPTRSPR